MEKKQSDINHKLKVEKVFVKLKEEERLLTIKLNALKKNTNSNNQSTTKSDNDK